MAETLTPDVGSYIEKKGNIEVPLSLPELNTLPAPLRETAERLAELTGQWNAVELYTPSNIEDKKDENGEITQRGEKSKFIEAYRGGEVYNPEFEYTHAEATQTDTAREGIIKLLSDVRRFKPANREQRLAKTAIYFKLKDDLATADFVDGIKDKDDKKIKQAFGRKYPGTDVAILEKANELYEQLTQEQGNKGDLDGILSDEEKKYLRDLEIDAEGIKQVFEWTLERSKTTDGRSLLRTPNNPHGYAVVIDKVATSIDVRDKSSQGPTVFIPEKRSVNGESILRLNAHEIEGHARQAFNGQELFGIGGGPLRVDNEMLYEGLGMRYEEDVVQNLFGDEFAAPLPYYTFAVQKAEEGGSFYEVFADQVNRRLHASLKIHPDESLPSHETIDKKTHDSALNSSWLTTFRVMRGHTDTANKESFAMAKDLGYLRGWLIDKNLRDNGLGYINESAVIASGALQLIAEFDLQERDLPIPFSNLTKQYWELVLKPQFLASDWEIA